MAAANTDKFKKLSRRWVGQIGAGGVADASTTTIPLSSATNLPTDTAVVAVVDRVDADGGSTPLLEETFIGVVSGSNLTSSVRGVEGTAQAHSAGAVVEILFTAKGWNDLIDGILANHTQDGSHDFDGDEVIIDADADTSMTADTDDQIDWKLGGSDRFRMKTSDFDMVTSTANITINGADPKRGFYWPASGMFAATTNGAASGQIETSSNKVNAKVFDFDASTEEYVCFNIPAPDFWDLGTITVQFFWTAPSGSGDVIWGAQALARSNDDALDTAYGTAQTVTDTLISANDEHVTSITSAITVGGTPAKGDQLYFRVYRDADAGGDTLNADARLLGVKIKFNMGQYDDQ